MEVRRLFLTPRSDLLERPSATVAVVLLLLISANLLAYTVYRQSSATRVIGRHLAGRPSEFTSPCNEYSGLKFHAQESSLVARLPSQKAVGAAGELAEDKFTLLVLSHARRLPSLQPWIGYYRNCSYVAEIVLVWNQGNPPDIKRDFPAGPVPVRLREEQTNSLNNRFKPDPLLKTRAVLELDDDVMIRCADIKSGFAAWRQNPDQIVGFFPRELRTDMWPATYTYNVFSSGNYNMILSKGAFLDVYAFELYWREEYAAGRAIVDELLNCEDILMNYIWAHEALRADPARTRPTILFSDPRCWVETALLSKRGGINNTPTHFRKRRECGVMFKGLLGGKDPLQNQILDARSREQRKRALHVTETEEWGPEDGTALLKAKCGDA